MPSRRRAWSVHVGALALATAVNLAGCGVKNVPLMPTPVIYTAGGLEPFRNLPDARKTPIVDIFYATNRDRVDDWQAIHYGNRFTDRIALGAAAMRIGGPGMTWERLLELSKTAERDDEPTIELSGVLERGVVAVDDPSGPLSLESAQFVNAINQRLAESDDSDIFVYVHGAKVNFYNAGAYTAQMAHFMGRQMVSVAFSWPTRQNLFAYAAGTDFQRAYRSGEALASFVEFLSANTDAERIHILCWSAGARVFSTALTQLRERYPDESVEALRARFRLGVAIFAAGDLPSSRFVEEIETMHALVDRLVVTVSDSDNALVKAARLMGGTTRLGQYGRRLSDEERERLIALERFELVDVSYGKRERGFNIAGHRYWFDHPWSGTDTLLLLRTRLDAKARGLEQGESRVHWWFPPDYPQRLAEGVRAIQDAEASAQ
ncbi:MAG: alpha/beta hydrolase [Phycisphaerales bacterium]